MSAIASNSGLNLAVLPERLLTVEDLLKMPDDGIERRLRNGILWEGTDVSRRSAIHSACAAAATTSLGIWQRANPGAGLIVVAGDAGFYLSRDPDVTVGADVAVVTSDQQRTQRASKSRLFDGAPILAIEILSPSDEHESVVDKILDYIKHGTKLVWIIDPELRTITVHRPDAKPLLFNDEQSIDGGPHLPGFVARVSDMLPLLDAPAA